MSSVDYFDSTTCTLAIGTVPISGFGDNRITISRDNDVHTRMDGVDGDVLFSKSNIKGGTISFDLLYGSDYDLLMDNMAGLLGVVPIFFVDTNSLKTLSTYGVISTQADLTIGENPENRTWTLSVASTDLSVLSTTADLYTTVVSNVYTAD